jgi:hypothetical protein
MTCKWGNQFANNAKSCPQCHHRLKGGFVKFLMIVVVLFGGLPVIGVIFGPSKASSPASDDADLLIARCGTPSGDGSSEYDNPRPPIPSPVIEYDSHKLRFAFLPGGHIKLGDPPPYQWKLIGITDMTVADPSQATAVPVSEAVERMPCWSREVK